jgi:SAM-dependent methyltransferase
MPFEDGLFGTAFFIVTSYFVDSPRGALNEAARLLRGEGKVVLGLVLRGSPCGQLYQTKREMGHRFYKYATFYTYAEVDMLLMQIGFSIEKVISTLFQNPGEVNHTELPRQGFSADTGFTVILAGKLAA